jgi:hypothetical protein
LHSRQARFGSFLPALLDGFFLFLLTVPSSTSPSLSFSGERVISAGEAISSSADPCHSTSDNEREGDGENEKRESVWRGEDEEEKEAEEEGEGGR